MEVFQNGRFSTGEPVYQIGVKNSDGTYDIKVFDLMNKEQAEAKLVEMGGGVKKPALKIMPEQVTENIENMTKLELEAMMRNHGVELDRRKTKTSLVAKAKAVLAKG